MMVSRAGVDCIIRLTISLLKYGHKRGGKGWNCSSHCVSMCGLFSSQVHIIIDQRSCYVSQPETETKCVQPAGMSFMNIHFK